MAEIDNLIASRYEGLTAQQRKAARFILDHQDDVALYSMRDLAAKAGIPAVTFVRLARTLGFDNYQSLRAIFKESLRNSKTRRIEVDHRYTERAREIQKDEGPESSMDLFRAVFSDDQDNLRKTYERNSAEKIIEAATLLEQSRQIFVLGQRSCFPPSYLFHYVSRLFRQDTVLIQVNAGMVADDLRGIGRADLLLAISVEPYTAEVVRAARYAKVQGARIIAITDDQLSPIGRLADIVILATCESKSFFHSVTALTSLVQALLAVLVVRGGERAVSAIDISEAQLGRFGAYWRDDGTDLA